ncbi:MAG TPA: peptidoglycan DD-metalloendopeptidase family protein [Gammaproteobacteria bacterium]|nr:peptidoglycan DD-metalloendopeptidase family protein [Gammaproteobacteria bacterium]
MRAAFATLIAAIMLASCVTVNPPTRITRGAGWYTVKPSDTLYSIAWRYGLDYKQLAQWNGIGVNEPIFPGQRLRLIQRAGTAVASTPPAAVSSADASTAGSAATATTEAAEDTSDSGSNPRSWLWPTDGKPLNTFLASQLDRRGIDIAGETGQPVRAVADGSVVYSGNGLAGYGNLIIIKHSDTYLSAYAYCQERLVQEGATVKAGNLVARMGLHDNQAKLHFEIRRNGKPVDPMKYLPDR